MSPPVLLAWMLTVLACLLGRMYVVADDSPISLKFDSVSYARTSLYYLQDSPFTKMPSHRPGLSLVAWGTAQFGIPYKLFLDFLVMAIAVYAGGMLTSVTRNHPVGLLTVGVVSFSPWMIEHSQLFMTEPLMAVLMLALLVSSMPFICKPPPQWTWLHSAINVVSAMLLVLVRNEFLLLIGFYTLLLIVVLIRNRRFINVKVLKGPGGWRVLFVVLPLFVAWAGTQAIKTYNDQMFGVAALCQTEASGFRDLMNALYRIEPEQNVRFAPVTRSSLEKACEHSQVLAMYRDKLLDPSGPGFETARKELDLEDEVGTWLNWHLLYSFGGMNRHLNHQMKVAAREVREALSTGKLSERFAYYPVSPQWREWLPEIPSTLWRALYHSFLNGELDVNSLYKRLHLGNVVRNGYLDDGLKRRHGSHKRHGVRIYGFPLQRQSSQFNRVQVQSSDGSVLAEFPILGRDQHQPYFSIELTQVENRRIKESVSLVMRRIQKSGAVESNAVPLPDQCLHQHFVFNLQNEAQAREGWLISSSRLPRPSRFRQSIRQLIYHWHWAIFCLTIIVSAVVGFFTRKRTDVIKNVAWVTFLGIAWIVARSLFYTLIHVWLAWGLVRYVEPNILTAMVVVVGLGFVAGGVVGRWVPSEEPYENTRRR